MSALEIGVRGVDFTVLELVAEIMGAEAVDAIMAAA